MRKLVIVLAMAALAAACSGDATDTDTDTATDIPTAPGAAATDAGAAGATDAGAGPTDAAGGAAAGETLTAALTGEAEVPGPGEEGATGEASVTTGDGEVCATITSDATEPMAAHIHVGTADVAGDVVIDLTEALGGEETCVMADQAVIDDILADPAGFYVNLHNAEFPDGAVRGQLA